MRFFQSAMLALLLTLGTGRAQDSASSGFSYSIGLGAGLTGGLGVSAEKIFARKHTLRVNFAPFYWEEKYPEDGDNDIYESKDSGYSKTGFLSLGLLYQYEMAAVRAFHFSTFAGGNYMGIYEDEDYYETSPYLSSSRRVKKYKEQNIFTLGFGFGAGVRFWRIRMTAYPGIRASYDVTRDIKSVTPSIDVGAHLLFR